jgi:dTDP-4-dehydrorhamnose reductase
MGIAHQFFVASRQEVGDAHPTETAKEFVKSLVILGSNGMLAHALAHTAVSRGHHPIAIPRSQCDITSEPQLRAVFEQHRPTVLFNCAAYTKVDAAETESHQANAINGYAVQTLGQLCRTFGTLLVHFGSDFVFDGRATQPYHEYDAPGPLCAYGQSKRLGEEALLADNWDNWLLLRTAWLYGPHGPCFPRTMVELARKGVPLSIVNDQIGSPTFTDDLADATFDLLDRQTTGLWHVVNADPASWYDLAIATLKAFDINHPIRPITTADWRAVRPQQATRPAYSVLDTSALTHRIARAMRPWREALQNFANQVRSAGSF